MIKSSKVQDLIIKFNNAELVQKEHFKSISLSLTQNTNSDRFIHRLTMENIKIKKQLSIFNAILASNQNLEDVRFISSIVSVIILKNNSIIENNNKLKNLMYYPTKIEFFEEKNKCYHLDNEILMCYVDSMQM